MCEYKGKKILEKQLKLSVEAYACNPSFFRGRGRRIKIWRPIQAKLTPDPISKIKIQNRKAVSVAQVEECLLNMHTGFNH
jgi:hypothetical protein